MKTHSSPLTVEAARLLQQFLGTVEKRARAGGGILKATCWL
jgi:hypothetical protein